MSLILFAECQRDAGATVGSNGQRRAGACGLVRAQVQPPGLRERGSASLPPNGPDFRLRCIGLHSAEGWHRLR